MAAAMPDRPYGMNHPFARQMITLRDLRFPRLAAMERPALREELRPRHLMDRAIHPALPKSVGQAAFTMASTFIFVTSFRMI